MNHFLIFHIGTPKTGTSAVQTFLYENQPLLEEQGFCYPCITKGPNDIVNGSFLFQYMENIEKKQVDTKNPGWIHFWNKIRMLLQERNVILSWEEIFNREIIGFFQAVQKEYANIKVIVYLRRQDRYIESWWNECVKEERNCHTSFSQFVNMPTLPLNYKQRLDDIAHIVGKENLIVRVYEKEQFRGEHKDIISDFLSALNIQMDWARCVVNKYANPPLFGNFIEIKRHMNQYIQQKSPQSRQLERTLLEFLVKRQRASVIRNADGMFTPEQRESFLEQFKKENSEIAQEYLERKDGILFYENQSIPGYELNDETLCEDVGDVFTFLIEKWKARIAFCSINPQTLSSSNDYVNRMQDHIIRELDAIRTMALPKELFEERCFEIIQQYTPFLVKIYRELIEAIILKSLKDHCRDRKIFCFGTGMYCQFYLKNINWVPDGFLNNHYEKQGQHFYGKTILHPSQIEDWSNCFVIITVQNPELIAMMEHQLQGYGLKKDEDYLVGMEYLIDSLRNW